MFLQVTLVGNLGRDPEMRYTPSGTAVTNFSVATNRQYTASSGEVVKETTWVTVSTWGKQAEVCKQYLRKGQKVFVQGRLNSDPETGGPRVWEKDGRSGAKYEITAETVKFLTSKEESEAMGVGETQAAGGSQLPFEPDAPAGDSDWNNWGK